MTLKGVVFDFNGTLLWDTCFHNEAWDIFLEKYNLRFSDQKKNEIIHGRNNELIFTDIFGKDLNIDEINTLVSEKEAIYRGICLDKGIDFAPGAIDFILFLKENNILCAIATASGKENVDFYINHLQLDKLVEKKFIVYNDGRYKSKPDPDIFLSTMQLMGLNNSEVVIFEDSYAGIKAASNAKPGKVIIVNSSGLRYDEFNFEIITGFDQVNRNLFR